MPSGMATTAHQKNAWAMRHQLMNTLPSRSYSVHNNLKDRITPSGVGNSEKCGPSQQGNKIQSNTMTPQGINGSAHRTQGCTSFRMVNQSLIVCCRSFEWLVLSASSKGWHRP